ncbi:hypothetical protein M0804_012558 [Polistes exclamans]|nr:hypothetical protein M0804_012558 [Polistes exclamans]
MNGDDREKIEYAQRISGIDENDDFMKVKQFCKGDRKGNEMKLNQWDRVSRFLLHEQMHVKEEEEEKQEKQEEEEEEEVRQKRTMVR